MSGGITGTSANSGTIPRWFLLMVGNLIFGEHTGRLVLDFHKGDISRKYEVRVKETAK